MLTALSRNSRTGREVERVAADLAGMVLSSSNAAGMRGRADSSTIDPQPASVVDTLDPNIEGAVRAVSRLIETRASPLRPYFTWFDWPSHTKSKSPGLDLHRL